MWLYIISSEWFEDTFENMRGNKLEYSQCSNVTYWREAIYMWPVWLQFCWTKQGNFHIWFPFHGYTVSWFVWNLLSTVCASDLPVILIVLHKLCASSACHFTLFKGQHTFIMLFMIVHPQIFIRNVTNKEKAQTHIKHMGILAWSNLQFKQKHKNTQNTCLTLCPHWIKNTKKQCFSNLHLHVCKKNTKTRKIHQPLYIFFALL